MPKSRLTMRNISAGEVSVTGTKGLIDVHSVRVGDRLIRRPVFSQVDFSPSLHKGSLYTEEVEYDNEIVWNIAPSIQSFQFIDCASETVLKDGGAITTDCPNGNYYIDARQGSDTAIQYDIVDLPSVIELTVSIDEPYALVYGQGDASTSIIAFGDQYRDHPFVPIYNGFKVMALNLRSYTNPYAEVSIDKVENKSDTQVYSLAHWSASNPSTTLLKTIRFELKSDTPPIDVDIYVDGSLVASMAIPVAPSIMVLYCDVGYYTKSWMDVLNLTGYR